LTSLRRESAERGDYDFDERMSDLLFRKNATSTDIEWDKMQKEYKKIKKEFKEILNKTKKVHSKIKSINKEK